MGIYDEMAEFLESDVPGEFRVRVPTPPPFRAVLESATAALNAAVVADGSDLAARALRDLLDAAMVRHVQEQCECSPRDRVDLICLHAQNLALAIAGT